MALTPVEIKTINGCFIFNLYRFKSIKGSSNYFRERGIFSDSLGGKGSYESKKLKDFVSYYATKISYENVSELSKERAGGVTISDQRIQQIRCG